MMAGDNANFWRDIDLRVGPYPFFTSFHISKIKKKPRLNTHLNPKTSLKWVFIDIIPAIYSKSLTKDTTFYNYLLVVDAYSKLPKLYRMENITTEEAMENLDMFQARFGKVDEFGWWDLEIIHTEYGSQFTFKEFQASLYVRVVRLELAASDHQEMNGQAEVTWRTLRTIAHSTMVHALVSYEYMHFSLMYMTDHIFPVLPIKYLVE